METVTLNSFRKVVVSFDDADGRRHTRLIDEPWADDYAAEMRERGHTNVTTAAPVPFRALAVEGVRDAA